MGQVSIKIGRMPGKIKPLFFKEGEPTTVGKALEKTQLDPTGYEVRVNGQKTTNMNTPLKDGDTVLLVKQIKGNS